MCAVAIAPALSSLASTVATMGAQTAAVAAKAAARKLLMTKIMTGAMVASTGLGIKQYVEGKKDRKEALETKERTSASRSDTKKTRTAVKARKAPGRKGLYV